MSARRARAGAARGITQPSAARGATHPTPAEPALGAGEPRGRRWNDPPVLAAAMAVFALVAVVASGYLTWVKLIGGSPVCFVVSGCDTVQQSSYSSFFGVPVALIGLLMALTVFAFVVAWWRSGDRRMLYCCYTVGLLAVFVIVYLNYLELFVIHAICIWCEIFAAAVLLGWLVTVAALRRRPAG